MTFASRQQLSGHREHFQHGPIDLIIFAEGDPAVVADAHDQAWEMFQEVLPTLVTELGRLRQPVNPRLPNPLTGPVARKMWQACVEFSRDVYITPMAAVAGSVAQHILSAYQIDGIDRAWVNNGGDIALHLVGPAQMRLGLCADVLSAMAATGAPTIAALTSIQAGMGIGGVATSGWTGRSHSLGIADSVTVFAADACVADAAATVVANAVNVEDGSIVRKPAHLLSDDTDLGDYLVTVDVPPLETQKVTRALQRGKAVAQTYVDAGLLECVVLVCQRQVMSAARAFHAVQEKALCHPL